MEEDKQEKTRVLLSAVIAGAAGGILMAAVLLFVLSNSDYRPTAASWIALYALACALPACLNFLRYRGIPFGISEILMVVISAVTCLVYVYAISEQPDTLARLNRIVIWLHGVSLVFSLIRLLLNQRRKGEAQ